MTTSSAPTVRTATPADVDTVTKLLVDAFHGGDLSGWLIEDDEERRRVYWPYMAIYARHYLRHGQVDLIDPGLAVAVWTSVNAQPVPEIVDYDEQLRRACGPYLPRFVALDRAIDGGHAKAPAPHAYLVFLAVTPWRQRKGLGRAVLRHRHQQLDRDNVPAYLQATGANNRRLYRRLGYTDYGAPLGIDDGPCLLPMLRPAQPGPDR